MIKSFIARNLYEPLYCRFYRKDDRLKIYKFYKKAQWNSLEKNRKIQGEKLYELIKYASENIPYYKRVVEKNKIIFSRDSIFEDIRKFPILTKKIIRKEFKNLYKIRTGTKYYYNTSGGSTGEPVKLIQDNDYEAESSAMTRLQYDWAGYELGETQVMLWGSEKDILKEKKHFKHKFANWMKSVSLLNSFLM